MVRVKFEIKQLILTQTCAMCSLEINCVVSNQNRETLDSKQITIEVCSGAEWPLITSRSLSRFV